jgi:hypothetical protein
MAVWRLGGGGAFAGGDGDLPVLDLLYLIPRETIFFLLKTYLFLSRLARGAALVRHSSFVRLGHTDTNTRHETHDRLYVYVSMSSCICAPRPLGFLTRPRQHAHNAFNDSLASD